MPAACPNPFRGGIMAKLIQNQATRLPGYQAEQHDGRDQTIL